MAAKSACEQADGVVLSCAAQIDIPPVQEIVGTKQLNQAMQDSLGVVRNGNSLLKGIQESAGTKRNSAVAWSCSSPKRLCPKRKPGSALAGGLS